MNQTSIIVAAIITVVTGFFALALLAAHIISDLDPSTYPETTSQTRLEVGDNYGMQRTVDGKTLQGN
jgi:hypothetical protein